VEGPGAAATDDAVTEFDFPKNGDSKNVPISITAVISIKRDFLLFVMVHLIIVLVARKTITLRCIFSIFLGNYLWHQPNMGRKPVSSTFLA